MYNEAKKKAIYKWREKNPDQWKEYHKEHERERYAKIRDKSLAYKKDVYQYKRFLYNCNFKIECEFIRNCLFESI